ncbi:hypothetical protein AXF14_04170 [Actinomyces radicidentis]|uniref:Uncharacterized protein n=1 Tax=Actinomyces radicidentis TaxID=111015 RepID=A0A0X8JE32_ACTRD|nr:hypothetical protein [Actinomyces radicidentis]AMD86936.1 hypothetical protein AXF14_04170 [Actinomyces radicidentis]
MKVGEATTTASVEVTASRASAIAGSLARARSRGSADRSRRVIVRVVCPAASSCSATHAARTSVRDGAVGLADRMTT